MNRRKFLKAAAAASAISASPAAIGDEMGAYPDFDQNQVYGGGVTISCWNGVQEALADGYDHFAPLIAAHIPPPFRHNVCWTVLRPRPTDSDPLGMRGKVGWRYPKFLPNESVRVV